MDLGIGNKVALVAASSQGLGKAVATGLAHEGAKVVMCSRNKEAIRAAAEDVKKIASAEVIAVQADLTVPSDIKRLVAQTAETFGAIHILVNNAGGPPAGIFADMSDDHWQRAVDLTLMSSVRLTRATLPFMRKQEWGRVINITSVSVKQPINELLLSNSLRLSVLGWSKTLSNQVAKDGILVNCVCPGWTRTERVIEIFDARAKTHGTTSDAVEASITAGIPMARLGKPDELANLVVFLASEKASYMTGTSIQVDGGAVQIY